MKNVHLIPTDKPSRLHCYDWSSYGLSKEHLQWKQGRNIYITSDEEIKEGDWVIKVSTLYKGGGIVEKYSFIDILFEDIIFKKIILTTDPDLIKDGVQAIDDEFLEWFVKNPSCEEVKIESWQTKGEWDLDYKIIIPKEEPTISEEAKQRAKNYMSLKGALKPKQETLEEVAERLAYDSTEENKGFPSIKRFIEGAKWQQERMYSEEEVLKILHTYRNHFELYRNIQILPDMFFEWFQQFKKK